MKFKIWDDFNKIMYFNAENIEVCIDENDAIDLIHQKLSKLI